MASKNDSLAEFFEVIRNLPDNTRELLQTIVLSLLAALSAVSFLLLTNYFYIWTYATFVQFSRTYFLIASFLWIMGTSLVVGLLLGKLNPEAAGSGIPQLKAAYWKEVGYVHWRSVVVKFIAGILSIGGGTSLGREGPTIYIGGGLSSVVSGFFGNPKRMRRGACVIGASAGLAAAFNTPLAAIAFILEEFLSDINSRFVGRVVLASVIGAFVVYAIIGRQPSFTLPSIETVSWEHYLVCPFVAYIASLLGVLFHRWTLFWRGRLREQTKVPAWFLPCIGGFATWVLAVTCFFLTGKLGVFGLGYQDLSSALANNFIWWTAGILVAAKLIATIASYSFGGSGGIFSPLLFIGGLCGYFMAGLMGLWIPLTPSDHIVLAAVGMTACLGAVIKAPLTSLLIVFEMTHQFALVPGLMIGIVVSKIVSKMSGDLNFYDALLIQDGHELIKIRPPLAIRAWQSLPVSSIVNPHLISITSSEEAVLREAIEKHPYNCFPVVINGELKGLATREQIQHVLLTKKPLDYQKAVTCRLDQTVRDVGDKFIESPSGVMVVLDETNSRIAGIITLHDLLRAQASIMD